LIARASSIVARSSALADLRNVVNDPAYVDQIRFEDARSNVTLGSLPPFDCAASAADDNNCLAMLVRRDSETLTALLKRLDKAIGMAWSEDVFIDEVNNGPSELL